MMYRVKISFAIIVCLLSFNTWGIAQEDNNEDFKSLVVSASEDSIQLEKGYAYYYLRASDKYLVWFEGYTDQIY